MLMLPEYSLSTLDVIHNMDALTLLRGLPDASVDAVIADPPYNITQLDFERPVDWIEFWGQCRRVAKSKRTPFILFSQQPFTTDLINSNRAGYRYEIIMEKTMPVGFLNANRRPLQAHENILIFGEMMPSYVPIMEESTVRRASTVNSSAAEHYHKRGQSSYVDNGSRYPRSVWRFAQRKSAFANTVTLHPTEKPLACLERLIHTYTQPGDLILDPFIGSGTTALAARNLGRHYIGCDISREYVDIARQRLSQPYMHNMFETIESESA